MSETTLAYVERLADQLPVDEQVSLLEHVARRVRLTFPSHPPQDLYGIWRDRIPADFDVDAALKEIRHESSGNASKERPAKEV